MGEEFINSNVAMTQLIQEDLVNNIQLVIKNITQLIAIVIQCLLVSF